MVQTCSSNLPAVPLRLLYFFSLGVFIKQGKMLWKCRKEIKMSARWAVDKEDKEDKAQRNVRETRTLSPRQWTNLSATAGLYREGVIAKSRICNASTRKGGDHSATTHLSRFLASYFLLAREGIGRTRASDRHGDKGKAESERQRKERERGERQDEAYKSKEKEGKERKTTTIATTTLATNKRSRKTELHGPHPHSPETAHVLGAQHQAHELHTLGFKKLEAVFLGWGGTVRLHDKKVINRPERARLSPYGTYLPA